MAIVYRHRRLDNSEIFYIGIGKNEKRAYNKNNNRSKFWKNVINKSDYVVEILLKNISWEKACELECLLISEYGRRDLNTGTLVNLTNGGDGYNNGPLSKVHKKKIASSHKGMRRSERTKSNISKSKTGVKFTDSHKYNLSKSHKKLYKNGYKHPQSKKIINISTGKIFDSIKEASKYYNIKRSTLSAKLTGQNKNDTNLEYYIL